MPLLGGASSSRQDGHRPRGQAAQAASHRQHSSLAAAPAVDGPDRFEVLDGAGHWIPETRLDQLSALVLDHLGSNAAPSAA